MNLVNPIKENTEIDSKTNINLVNVKITKNKEIK